MPPYLLPAILAILAGCSIVIQQVLNSNLRTAINSAAWAGFVSYFVGVACMMLLAIVFREPVPTASVVMRLSWWEWCGGVFGAIFIGLAIMLVPILGAATFIALLVGGQMLTSMIIDHFGWMGVPKHSFDLTRAFGAILLVAGVTLVRR